MAELCGKVEPTAVEPYIGPMMAALLVCFKDESWPCRDAASTACSQAVAAYPDATAPKLEELYTLWFELLWDNVPSVRENVAVALGRVSKAMPQDALPRMNTWLEYALVPVLSCCSFIFVGPGLRMLHPTTDAFVSLPTRLPTHVRDARVRTG
jgi:hypothetical protein